MFVLFLSVRYAACVYTYLFIIVNRLKGYRTEHIQTQYYLSWQFYSYDLKTWNLNHISEIISERLWTVWIMSRCYTQVEDEGLEEKMIWLFHLHNSYTITILIIFLKRVTSTLYDVGTLYRWCIYIIILLTVYVKVMVLYIWHVYSWFCFIFIFLLVAGVFCFVYDTIPICEVEFAVDNKRPNPTSCVRSLCHCSRDPDNPNPLYPDYDIITVLFNHDRSFSWLNPRLNIFMC